MNKPKHIDTFLEVIGKPKFITLNSYILALKRNLILLSFVIITYKLSGAKVNTQNGIILLGIPFDNFSPCFVDKALLGYLIYSFLHYIIDGYEAFMTWRIRLTGLFNLALIEGSGFGLIGDGQAQIQDIGWGLGKDASLYSLFLQAIKPYTSKLSENLKLKKSCEDEICNILKTINVGVNRFEHYFKIFQWYQVTRFFLIDILFPIMVSVYAFYLLIC